MSRLLAIKGTDGEREVDFIFDDVPGFLIADVNVQALPISCVGIFRHWGSISNHQRICN